MSSCIEQLFATPHLEAFLAEYWPGRSVSAHGPLERFGALSSLPALQDVRRVASVFQDPVMVMLPDKRDESSAIKVERATALAHYEKGLALCFETVNPFIPVVDQWLQAIRRELGLPSACFARSLVYATKRGGGNRPHFDANANIVVQLRGTKRWTIAPNTLVVNPTDRWVMGVDTPPPGSKRGAVLPREMPEGAEVIDLLPGSVLLLPRGYWHATEAVSEDTLALNFTYSQPTWAEVLTAALLSRLHMTPFFRGLADGLESTNPERLTAAQDQLGRMLEVFKGEVHQLASDEVLAALESEEGGETTR